MRTIHKLNEGGILLYDDAFLPEDLASQYLEDLKVSLKWEQKEIKVFDKICLQGRLTAGYGDDGINYQYSGSSNPALPWTPTLLEIKGKVEALEEYPLEYNYCLLNRYRDGKDSIGMHSDDERGMSSVIASLSLGATRDFKIQNKTTKEKMNFPVGNGTLIVMAGPMQRFWKHGVPATKKPVGERINLTFRKFK